MGHLDVVEAKPEDWSFDPFKLTEKDGWKQPQNGQDFVAAAQKWCKEHAGSYRIERLVPEKAEK